MIELKACLIALAVGLLVGAFYGLLNVRSPAPPVVALVGLLGILLGEQVAPTAKHLLAGKSFKTSAEVSGNKRIALQGRRTSSSIVAAVPEQLATDDPPKNAP